MRGRCSHPGLILNRRNPTSHTRTALLLSPHAGPRFLLHRSTRHRPDLQSAPQRVFSGSSPPNFSTFAPRLAISVACTCRDSRAHLLALERGSSLRNRLPAPPNVCLQLLALKHILYLRANPSYTVQSTCPITVRLRSKSPRRARLSTSTSRLPITTTRSFSRSSGPRSWGN